jgi:GH15 family glucan-1,4-alpha-glucosidase
MRVGTAAAPGSRIDGYAAIRDYALIGDGRTAALVAADGAVDWLCLPNFDSPSVAGALLDAERGGSFVVRPTIPFTADRRYVPDTNVLETTFRTASGVVRIVDALTLPADRLAPMRELARVVTGVEGSVPMSWTFDPAFQYGAGVEQRGWRGRIPVATHGSDAIAVLGWDAGEPSWRGPVLQSTFTVNAGARATIALVAAYAEPLILPARAAVERRLASTIAFWERWTKDRRYRGPWPGAVLRSALALKALIFAPSGASVAAPTTSLPEDIGGERNWDYRFCWIRDSNFAIAALLNLGCYSEAESLFWWFMNATALTEPELHVLYRLDGGVGAEERTLPLDGHRRSRPVRVGNAALEQTQLDIYGCLFETARLYSDGQQAIDPEIGTILGRIADRVCAIWRQPDSGIWEVRNGPFHFTHSKVMCWVALDRALRLAQRGELPLAHAARWQSERDAVRAYVESDGWSDALGSYRRIAGEDDVDASLLMLPIVGFGDPKGPRMQGTIDAIMRRLLKGDFLYRYAADDGVKGGEGCFLNCSFWLVSALARAGRVPEATALMERLLARANDVGLYAEEVDPTSGAFLGNFPQALVHLALIDAAIAVRDAGRS